MGKITKLPPAKSSYPQGPENPRDICMVIGNMSKESAAGPKTSGIKMRGTGAATKGTMSRGPMA